MFARGCKAPSPILPIGVLLFFATSAVAGAPSGKSAAPNAAALTENYGKLPLSFEANQGQAAPDVKFVSHGTGYSLLLTDRAALLSFSKSNVCHPERSEGPASPTLRSPHHTDPCPAPSGTIRMSLTGAHPAPATGESELPGKVNYFLGSNPANWHTNLPTYAAVRYTGVYDGVDLKYYGNQNQLEYDFLVAPGANPAPIRLTFSGQKRLYLEPTGNLILQSQTGQATLHKPVLYQEIEGHRHPIQGSFRLLAKNTVVFQIGNYDHAQPLIIDPILVYSTYLGGSGSDSGNGIAVDADGNAYITGSTNSLDFPVTAGAYQTGNKAAILGNGGTAFVTKLNSTGTALIYSTYLGGSGTSHSYYGTAGDTALAIALDAANSAYVTGNTFSADFPVTAGVLQTVNKSAPNGQGTAFVTKLSPAGDAIEYSTYLGGTHTANCSSYLYFPGESGSAIAVDGQGNAYIGGYTTSVDFPVTAGALQLGYASTVGAPNGFVSKLNQDGTALTYSTYLGGAGWYYASCTKYGDQVNAIAVNKLGNAYVAGSTPSSDFPVTSGVFQPTLNGQSSMNGPSNAFITELNAAGTAEVFSTYLGGTRQDGATAMALDPSGNVYIGGSVLSYDFPTTPGALFPNSLGNPSGFVAKLSPNGSSLEYGTYFGGPSSAITALAVDSFGNAYITGDTGQNGMPTTPDAVEPGAGGSAFIAKLNQSATALDFATDLSKGYGNALTIDSAGNAYVTGSGVGGLITTSGAFQSANAGGQDAFVTKLALAGDTTDHGLTTTKISASSVQLNEGQPITLTATVTGAAGSATPTGNVAINLSGTPLTVALNGSGIATWTSSTLAAGTYSASASYAGDAVHLTSSTASSGPASFQVIGSPASITGGVSPGPYQYGSVIPVMRIYVEDSSGLGLAGVTVNFSGAGLTFCCGPYVTGAGVKRGYLVVRPDAHTVGNLVATASVSGLAQTLENPLTITPAPLTLTILPQSTMRYYGAANPNFKARVDGLVGGDTLGGTVTVSVQDAASKTSSVGVYPVTATVAGANASDYAVTVAGGRLKVLPAPLFLFATSYRSTYGQTPPQPTAYSFKGFLNGDTASVVSGSPTLSTTVSSTTPVGCYGIKVGTGTLTSPNYSIALYGQPGDIAVGKAPLTVTANHLTMHQGGPIPPLTFTYSGFVNGDAAATALTGAPVLATTATTHSKPGTYPIYLSTGTLASHNYHITGVAGTLTITP